MMAETTFIDTLRAWVEISMHRSMRAFIHHNRESDLSFSQANTLFRLYHHGPSPISDLADHLGITLAGVSQLLNPLIDAGYIIRSTNPADRRVKLISLTGQGTAAVKAGMQSRHAWVEDFAHLLTQTEKTQILAVLELLNDRIQELIRKEDPECDHHSRKPSEDEKDLQA